MNSELTFLWAFELMQTIFEVSKANDMDSHDGHLNIQKYWDLPNVYLY